MGIYEDYLMHFNPYHDERGRFTDPQGRVTASTSEMKRTYKLAKKAAKQHYDPKTPIYKSYEIMNKDHQLNEALRSYPGLHAARDEYERENAKLNRLWDEFEGTIGRKADGSLDLSKSDKAFDAIIKQENLTDELFERQNKLGTEAINYYLNVFGKNPITPNPKALEQFLKSREYQYLIDYANTFYAERK